MKRTKVTELAAIASEQWGMVSTGQAAALGIDARTLADLAGRGVLERLAHGIYRLAGSPPSPHDDLREAWLALDRSRTAADRIAAGPTEVVSHRSAAAVHQLGDVAPDMLDFTTSVRRQSRRYDVRIHRGPIEDGDWTLADGLPITTPLRTIEDLAEARIDRSHLAGVVRDAITQHGVSVAQIIAVLAPYARSYGATPGDGRQLVALLLDEAGIPRSILEVAAYAGVEAQRQARESMAPLAQQDSIEVSGQLVSSLIRAMAADPAFEGAIRAIVGETLAVTAPPGPDATPGDAHTSATGGRYDEQ